MSLSRLRSMRDRRNKKDKVSLYNRFTVLHIGNFILNHNIPSPILFVSMHFSAQIANMSLLPWVQPRPFSGDLYGNGEKLKKPTSSGSASVKLTAPVVKADDSNVVVHLLWDTQSLLASAWGMHSSLPPFFSPQVPKIASELRRVGLVVPDETIKRVLHGRYADGNPDKALDLLVMIEDSNDGIVARIKPDAETKLVGAENHGGTTCYLDTLFFAMFAKIDAFEVVLESFCLHPSNMKVSYWLSFMRNSLTIGYSIQHI